jgi:hypothetical protein
MVHRYVSDAKEVDIEVPVGLVDGATTVVEVDGRFEKSCADSVADPQMKRGTHRLTEYHGKVKPG